MKKIISTASSLLLFCATHAQNVGIGITPQRAKLEVDGVANNGSTTALFSAAAGGGVSIQPFWPTIGFNQYRDAAGSKYISNGFAAVQYLDIQNGGLFFDLYSSGASNLIAPTPKRAFAILQSGNAAIGSSSSNSSLTVSRNSGSEATTCLFGTTHNSFFNFGTTEDTYIRAGKNNGKVFINDVPGGNVVMSGKVGINTATPGYTLEVRQHNSSGLALVNPFFFNHWEISTGAAPAGNLDLYYNGEYKGYFSPSDGDYITFSDIRLKTDIRQLPPSLGKIMQLQPVEYEMKNHNPEHQKTIGFIAQDVKKVFPELVHVLQDTAVGRRGLNDLHSLSYKGFGVLAIKAIQEQQQIILAQQVQINELAKTVDGLYRQLYKKE
jgi:hypothetical protein